MQRTLPNIKTSALIGLALFITTTSDAQQRTCYGKQANAICPKSISVSYAEVSGVPSFIIYGEHSTIKAESAEQLLTSALKIRSDEKLVLYREETDKLGFANSRYQQYYKNIKVEGGQYLVHQKNGNIRSLNGLWIDNINVNVAPSISEQQALQAALDYTHATRYKWQVPEEEAFIKQLMNDPSATYYPKAEMAIVAKDFDYKKHEFHCCYKFDVFADVPMSRNWVYVDISSGEIVATESRICSSDVVATANTMYSGIQTIITDSTAPANYRLREASRGLGIETYNMNHTTNFGSATDFTNTTTFWNTLTNQDNAAYDVHWAMESSYDYYLNVHNRNSIDNAGKKILAYVHYSTNYSDANHLPGGIFIFGDGTGLPGGFNPFTAIEICGHEFTHGVTQYSAALHYGSESGALNESFSDIFGTCIEFYKKPLTADFEIGEEIAVTAGTLLRSMDNPNVKMDPDTYHGTYWSTSPNDYGSVHTNSSVQNFWFYLLCQGGSGTNDIGSNYNVSGIGMTEAEQIVYRNLTVYLSSFSNYADARLGSIQAAQDLYGVCSPEVIAVTNAWYAVGVGDTFSAKVIPNFTVNGVYSCSVPFDVNFSNLSVNATNAHWDFGDTTTSSSLNPTHTYTAPGTYTVKLLASSTCGTDSLEMNSYITISTPAAPNVTSDSACGADSLNLSASGSGTLDWYTTPTGGTSVNTGANYTTPVLNSTTTYYVEDKIAGTVANFGPTTWQGQFGDVHAQYVNFDIYQSCTLVSLKTNSYAVGTRNVVLRDNTGAVLQDLPVTFPVGLATINLNFPLAPGTGYRIGGDSLSFAFDGTNTAYPYTLPGVASITGNTISNLVYLFFYDWQFETSPCISVRTPVTANIFPLPAVTYDASLYDTLNITDAPVTLTGGLPAGGTYSGTGVNGGIFDPSVSGVGDFTITYSYTDSNGCNNTVTQPIHVGANTGIDFIGTQTDILIYPNPFREKFIVECRSNEILKNTTELQIFNVLGEKVYSSKLSNERTEISISNPPGVYFYRIIKNMQEISSGKMVML